MKILSQLIAGGAFVQLLMIISILVASRLYSPDVFGELSWYLSFASLFCVIGALRLDYIVLNENIVPKEKKFFFINAVLVNIINLFILLMILIFFSVFFKYKHNILYLWFFCVSLSIFNLISQYSIVIKVYNKLYIYKLFQLLIQILMLCIFYYFIGDNGLIFANLLPQIIIGFYFFIMVRKKIVFPKTHEFLFFFKKNKKNAIKNTLLSVVQYSTPVAPIIFGEYFFHKNQIGAYFLFSQAISGAFALLRRNFLILLNGEYSEKYKVVNLFNNIVTLKNFMFILLIISISMPPLIFLSNKIIANIFGISWVEFSWLLPLLFIYYFLDAIFQPFSTLYPLLDAVNKALIYEGVRFLLVVVVLPLATYFLSLSFFYFILLFIINMILIYILIFRSIFFYVKK